MESKLKECCTKFMEHTIKYSVSCNKQNALEKLAFQNGIISKECYINLREKRLNTVVTMSNLAYEFNLVCEKLNKQEDIEIIKGIINKMISICK